MLMVGPVVVGMLGASVITTRADESKVTAEKSPSAPTTFACPIHPQIQATFPGGCPICRMALKAKKSGTVADAAPTTNQDGHSHAGIKLEGMPMGAMNCPQCMMGMGAMSHAATTPAAGAKIATPTYRMAAGRCCGR